MLASLVLLSCFGLGWPLTAVGLLFAVLPDIDYPKSIPGRLCPWSAQIWKRVGHRTATHSLLFLGLFYIAGPAAFLGLASHILLDLLTPSGVQLLWPRNTSYVILGGPVKTGSRAENMLFVLLVVTSLFLIVALACHRTPFELLTEVFAWSS